MMQDSKDCHQVVAEDIRDEIRGVGHHDLARALYPAWAPSLRKVNQVCGCFCNGELHTLRSV